jgi:hypothetical protein
MILIQWILTLKCTSDLDRDLMCGGGRLTLLLTRNNCYLGDTRSQLSGDRIDDIAHSQAVAARIFGEKLNLKILS